MLEAVSRTDLVLGERPSVFEGADYFDEWLVVLELGVDELDVFAVMAHQLQVAVKCRPYVARQDPHRLAVGDSFLRFQQSLGREKEPNGEVVASFALLVGDGINLADVLQERAALLGQRVAHRRELQIRLG